MKSSVRRLSRGIFPCHRRDLLPFARNRTGPAHAVHAFGRVEVAGDLFESVGEGFGAAGGGGA
jgi:hypothetical protein